MSQNVEPLLTIKRLDTPTIYLDTCAMIELCRYENGICISEHIDKIGELYNVLSDSRQNSRIICLYGDQLDEMGMTKGRKDARSFLFDNTDYKLIHSDLVKIKQLQIGYQAYKRNDSEIAISTDSFFDDNTVVNSHIKIHIAPILKQDKAEALKQEKERLSELLNKLKQEKVPLEERTKAELNADFTLFYSNYVCNDLSSQKKFDYYIDELEKFYRVTMISPECTQEERTEEMISYMSFLKSPYHYKLPYIDIASTLWANLICRPNKIIPSDWLDNRWASGYLPFSNYIVTDNSFFNLINNSGLLMKYDTKAYKLSTLGDLIAQL